MAQESEKQEKELELFIPPGPRLGNIVIEAEGVSKGYGDKLLVENMTFRLPPGGIVGVIGPNGAGKTTVFDLISGFAPRERGRVVLGGVDVSALPTHRRAALGLGRSFQDARLFSGLTVTETLAVALDRWVEVKDPFNPIFRLPAYIDSEDRVALRVDELLDLFALGDYRNSFVGELSTGTRRIVDLAGVVAHSPTVLLLDEPSSGIAQREAEALGPLIRRLRDELGCAVLVIEHDMALLRGVSDRLVAMDAGGVIAEGPCAEVLDDPIVIESYLGNTVELIARSGTRAGPVA
jgi:branched-chain amino acid transport system ATP-binding protein